MKNKLFIIMMTALLSVGFLAGCNADNDVEPLDVDNGRFQELDRDIDPLDNDRMMRRNRGLNRDMDVDRNRGLMDRDMDLDNGVRDFDFDVNNNNIRRPGEMDTPFNMDEEEPDLDEEPSEERRD